MSTWLHLSLLLSLLSLLSPNESKILSKSEIADDRDLVSCVLFAVNELNKRAIAHGSVGSFVFDATTFDSDDGRPGEVNRHKELLHAEYITRAEVRNNEEKGSIDYIFTVELENMLGGSNLQSFFKFSVSHYIIANRDSQWPQFKAKDFELNFIEPISPSVALAADKEEL